ncbi:MAG: hypothetical protein A2Z20_09540 [Bdellovibrionales bacterium RBG_16_40_8]|nr:MAG: hypothetical protein A2Z20_09540 [Bdellovibrionales bacterium RBG_16_40_8]
MAQKGDMKSQSLLYTLSISLGLYFFQACSDVQFADVASKVKQACEGYDCPIIQTVLVEQDYAVSGATNAVDILFVLDNSGSMEPELEKLADKFPNFIGSLNSLDWQVCATTTDISDEDGKLLTFPNKSKWINKNTADSDAQFKGLLENLIKLGTGSSDERGIYAINRALDRNEGCFRDGAALSTVIISDEDERSTGGYYPKSSQFKTLGARDYVGSIFTTLASKGFGQKIYTNHSIIVRPAVPALGVFANDTACYATQINKSPVWYGTHYAELSRVTDGTLGDICADYYDEQLEFAGKNITNSLASIQLACAPVSQSGITITIASQLIKSINPGLSSGTATKLAGNKLTFTPALPEGTTLSLSYFCAKK